MFTVGDDSDGAVNSLATVGGRLYAIKDKAIYTVSLADDIDPERTREDIPNTVQKVFDVGSKDDLVIRTLLTGIELFKKDRLSAQIDYEAALSSVMEILKDLAAASVIFNGVETFLLKNRENRIRPRDGAVSLPSFPALYADTKSFIQKLDHAMQSIFNLCCVFYDEKTLRKAGKWLDGLAIHLSNTLKPDEEFSLFAGELATFGKMVRNTRHCIEHPKATQRIDLHDYRITASRSLEEPTITVTHEDTPIDPTPIGEFMRFFYEQALAATELLMVFLAGYHVDSLGKLPVGVGEIPENQRKDGVRYGYLIQLGEAYHRLG